jgi:poly-gamma-glutamate capsule biosynthesis protein CapA/YwtB (metallophosphatase superfamily)
VKIAFLSATQIERVDNPDTKGATENSPGVFRCRNVDMLLEEVTRAKAENDFVVVYIHWGTESTSELDWAQKEQAPKIAAAGADLIIGDHPHVLQGITYYGETPVIYSLGNFLFNSKTLDTCLVKVTLDSESGALKNFQFIPALQKDCYTSLLAGSEKDRVIRYMQSLSPEVLIDGNGFVTKP